MAKIIATPPGYFIKWIQRGGRRRNTKQVEHLVLYFRENLTAAVSVTARKQGSHTPMSRKGRPARRHYPGTTVIPMLRFNADFRAWTRELQGRPVDHNPLAGREIVGAALNRLPRLAFTLVRNQTFCQTLIPGTDTPFFGGEELEGWSQAVDVQLPIKGQ